MNLQTCELIDVNMSRHTSIRTQVHDSKINGTTIQGKDNLF